jgi:hypothetical protein
VTDPITTSVATALATGATAALSDGVRLLITKLASLVRERLGRHPSDQEALESATRGPRDDITVQRLAAVLARHMRDDPVFAEQLRTLWTEIAAAAAHHGDQITNVASGPVHGSVVQARDVQGGITFHAPAPPSPHPPN